MIDAYAGGERNSRLKSDAGTASKSSSHFRCSKTAVSSFHGKKEWQRASERRRLQRGAGGMQGCSRSSLERTQSRAKSSDERVRSQGHLATNRASSRPRSGRSSTLTHLSGRLSALERTFSRLGGIQRLLRQKSLARLGTWPEGQRLEVGFS